MKKIMFLIGISIALLFMSCEKVGKVCHVSDPLTELQWLASIKGQENISISKVIFKDKKEDKKIEGFIIGPNEPYVNYIIAYYNCSGEILCSIGGFAGFQCQGYEIIKEEVIYETN